MRSDMTMELSAWLGEHGLEALEPILRGAHVEMDVIAELGNADLIELGLSLGDRKRLLRAIAGLRTEGPSGAARMAIGPRAAGPLERRHLTVMFCDLVGSTALSARMDPEELRELIVRYHAAVVSAIRPFGGYVAQLLGDGVLAYFGYPTAQEDDPVQAVRAALATVHAVSALALPDGCRLPVRIGIATGPVVVGQIAGQGDATEISATGGTPNLAARLQGIARPSEVVVSETTRRLLEGHFELRPLGVLGLKGFCGGRARIRGRRRRERRGRRV